MALCYFEFIFPFSSCEKKYIIFTCTDGYELRRAHRNIVGFELLTIILMLLMLSHDEYLDANYKLYKTIAMVMAMVLWWILLFEIFTWLMLRMDNHSRTTSADHQQ